MNTDVWDVCSYCGGEIEDPASTPRINVYDGEPMRREFCHRECVLRQTIGGLNHLRGTCQCKGGPDEPDPPEMSKREAAIAAVNYWKLTRGQ